AYRKRKKKFQRPKPRKRARKSKKPPKSENTYVQRFWKNPPRNYILKEPTKPISSYARWIPPEIVDVNNITVNIPNTITASRLPKTEFQETEVFKDARDQWYFPIRPSDGEHDTDVKVKKKWSLDTVLQFLQSSPKHIRQLLLTSLFGSLLGLILDTLFGGPWNLTSRLLRLIISVVPGGRILLTALDGLGYFLGNSANPIHLIENPMMQAFGNSIQKQISPRLAEDIIKAADEQIGGGFMRTIASILSAAASAGTHFTMALPAIPIAAVRPFMR
nr:32K [Ovine adenovirus 7]